MGPATTTTSHDGSSNAAPLVVLVLLTALVPAGCVLWFLNAAMENQQLAVKQRLTDVYRSQFDARKDGINAVWKKIEQKIRDAEKLSDPREIYELLVIGDVCSAVIVRDSQGRVLYPRQAEPVEIGPIGSDFWDEIDQLESDGRYIDAAAACGNIATQADNVHLAARAMQGQIRCLVRAGSVDDALDLITGPLSESKYRNALDADGRLIAPAAKLMGLQLGGDKLSSELHERLINQLTERLWDDRDEFMPAAQRLFLVDALRAIRPGAGPISSDGDAAMRASRLDNSQTIAGSYLDASDSREKASGGLFPAGVTGMWTIGSDDLRIVAIFSESQIDGIIQAVCDALPAIGGGEIVVGHYASDTPATQAFLSEPIGKQMPGWQISLSLVTPDPFQAAADKQRLVYITIACVAIGVIAVLAGASAKYIRKQMKLTRLKNDFVATVSHELKTPLASMRVLIDTLVAGRITDQAQADEYLQIIARENTRLSRLIDNFLTFSRMERNKCAFEFNKLDVAELVAEAVASAGERFGGAEPCLAVEAAPDLPPITGDQDALVTVILNLLDNAWKYSGDNRKIRLQAVADGQFVCIKVSDNGIGMAPRTVRRIFTRFYQADRKLTALGGCGLGLSIVKFILDAHGGLIEVVSRPGDGSTFIVKLPAQQISKGDS